METAQQPKATAYLQQPSMFHSKDITCEGSRLNAKVKALSLPCSARYHHFAAGEPERRAAAPAAPRSSLGSVGPEITYVSHITYCMSLCCLNISTHSFDL